jgi:hypothetical protein
VVRARRGLPLAGYVLHFTVPVTATGNYDIRICARTGIPPADGQCAHIVFGIS